MNKIETIRSRGSKIKKEFQNKIIGYIVAAFGLVAGLAWNEAVKALIENFFPLSQNGMLAKFIYAIAITLVLVIVTVYLTHLIAEKEVEEKVKK
ncbi:MAG: DUF5654 family protein [Parcubacteria group bacterium]|jgi:uncharacterized membrane protein